MRTNLWKSKVSSKNDAFVRPPYQHHNYHHFCFFDFS